MLLLTAAYQRLTWVSLLSCLLVTPCLAECRDSDDRSAADAKALSLYPNASVFKAARVLKRHHPSRNKEVASYIQIDNKHYSVFTLVFDGCRAEFRKRTRRAR